VTFLFGQCPTDSSFIEVTIRKGATTYGSKVIKLTHEGIIYSWRDCNWKQNSYFIPLDFIDYRKYCNVQKFIWKKELFNFNKENLPQTNNNIDYHFNIKIEFLDVSRKYYKVLYYDNYDKRIEKLVVMMIDLIPLPYQVKFKSLKFNEKHRLNTEKK
jgi:hypothetical protein